MHQILRKMFDRERWIWNLANLFCALFFFSQLYYLIPTYISPSTTNTEWEKVPLERMEFPLDIEICVSPLLNETALRLFGYVGVTYYHMGVSSDQRLVGWGGFNAKSEALTSAEGVLQVSRANVTSNLLQYIFIRSHGNMAMQNVTDQVTIDRINWLEECHILNLSRIANLKVQGMQELVIFFNSSNELISNTNFTLEIKIRDKALALRRKLMEHQFFHSGSKMKIEEDKFSIFMIKIKKNVFVEEDTSKNCSNYPNSDFASYMECDSRYMQDSVKAKFPGLDLMPPWLTDDLEEVTTKPVQYQNEASAMELNSFFLGTDTSHCPLPCTTISTETKLGNKMIGGPGIALEFYPIVEVREQFMKNSTF